LPGIDLAGLSLPDVELTLVDSEKAEKTSLSGFRGNWLLLQFASTYDRDSESLGRLFCHVRESLEGKSIRYLRIYDDPSPSDVRLFGDPAPRSVRAIVSRQRDLGIVRPRRLPAWILADPSGKIRLVGGWDEPDAIRQRIRQVLVESQEFSGVDLSPSRLQSLVEKSAWLFKKRKYAEGLAAAEQLLAEFPVNEDGLICFTYCKNWTDGYTKAAKALEEKLRDANPDERLRLFQAMYQILDADTWSARETIHQIAGRHPESLYLRALALMFTKPPDSLAREEEDLLVTGARTPLDEMIRTFRAYVLQSAGRLEASEHLFRMTRSRENLGLLPLAANLARQGRIGEAWGAIEFESPPDSDAAGPREAWLRMHVATVLQDWKTAAAFAKRYQEVRPEKMQGILVEWLASCVGGDSRPDLREKALALAGSSDRYATAKKLLAEGRLPGPEDIGKFSDANLRYDTALLFILLEWERNGPGASRRLMTALLPANNVSDWGYAVIEQLRSFPLTAPEGTKP
jgi:hypothetical protein